MTLARTQALFWEAVRSRRAPRALHETFVSRGALDAKARMQIYRAAYWSRYEKALAEQYPRLSEHLGRGAFRELVAGYIERHPPTDPSIDRVGAQLPTYIGDCASLGERRLVLRELARLEHARIAALLAPDPRDTFDPSALGAQDAPDRALRMLPSLSTVAACAVWRGPRGVLELPLADEEKRALDAALARAPLREICAQFAEPNATERARCALASWIARGWITGLEESCT
jgi:hypothetical protein